jgi:hypothetical protein
MRKKKTTGPSAGSGRPAATPASPSKVTVGNVNVPGYTRRVGAEKYGAMQRALLRVLPSRPPGITQAEMFVAVRRHLPEDLFPGGAKANWWAKTVQLDLERHGTVRRSAGAKPLRWYRSTAGRRADA